MDSSEGRSLDVDLTMDEEQVFGRRSSVQRSPIRGRTASLGDERCIKRKRADISFYEADMEESDERRAKAFMKSFRDRSGG